MSKIIKITYRLIPVIVIRHHIRLMAVTKITRKFETCPPLTIRIMSFKRHDAMLLGVITFQNETDPNQNETDPHLPPHTPYPQHSGNVSQLMARVIT